MSPKPIDPTRLSVEDARPAHLRRSYTGEGGNSLSPPLRTETNISTTSLPATAALSKRLHDKLSLNHSSTHLSSLNLLQKHKRKESSKEDSAGSAESGSGARGPSNLNTNVNATTNNNNNSSTRSDATSSPRKGASALLHNLVPKSSSTHGIGHSRSASALERIASRTPGLRNTPLASAAASPHQSVANIDVVSADDPALRQHERPPRTEDVLRERQRNNVRMNEVREAYMSVDQRARTAESRLEDVYGELMGKVRILRGTIGELQTLVGDVTTLQEKFERETGEVDKEYGEKIRVFEEFKAQTSTIDECGRRIEEGRDKVKVANGRLEAARVRVEEWERREEEWQQKTSSEFQKLRDAVNTLIRDNRTAALQLDNRLDYSWTDTCRRCSEEMGARQAQTACRSGHASRVAG